MPTIGINLYSTVIGSSPFFKALAFVIMHTRSEMQAATTLTKLGEKRAVSEPPPRRVKQCPDARPDPWTTLGKHGDELMRTATTLAELAVATNNLKETWHTQISVADAISHEVLVIKENAFRRGLAHGKWLAGAAAL